MRRSVWRHRRTLFAPFLCILKTNNPHQPNPPVTAEQSTDVPYTATVCKAIYYTKTLFKQQKSRKIFRGVNEGPGKEKKTINTKLNAQQHNTL